MARRSNNKGGSSKLVKSARRNVRLQTAPQRNAIDRSELQAGQDYTRALQAARSAYGGFQNELQDQPQFPLNRLTNQLQDQLGTFHGMLQGSPSPVPEGIPTTSGGEQPQALPTGLPGSEQAAGKAVYSQLGDNAFNILTNTASRDEMYSRSAGREGALAERYAKENLIQDLQDQLQGFDQRRMEIADLQGPMIQQELERLRQEHQDDASNRALMDYLMGSIRGDLSGGGGGGGGGGGPRHGGGNPNAGVVHPGGATGGYGAGDTAAGGNQGISQGSTQGVPLSWQNANTYNQLPRGVRMVYDRPQGTSIADFRNSWGALNTPGHDVYPSFDTWEEFIRAYRAFLSQINTLNRGAGPNNTPSETGGGY